MKLPYTISLTILIILFNYNCYAQYTYQLEIDLPEGFNGSKSIFVVYKNDARKIKYKDSIIVVANKVHYTGSINQESNFASIIIRNGKIPYNLRFVIDTGKNKFVVKRSAENFVIIDSQKTLSNIISDELDSVYTHYFDLYRTEKKIKGSFGLPLELQNKVLISQLNLLKNYPNSYFSLVALSEVSGYRNDINYLKSVLDVYQTFITNIKSTSFGKEFFNAITKKIENQQEAKAGNAVKIFTVKDVYGKPFTNQLLLGQNYVIVFSATWCLPCQKQLPMLKKIYNIYKSKGLKVVYFNQDDNVLLWKKHIIENRLSWINVSERLKARDSKIANTFFVTAIPTCFVVNKFGHIVYNSEQNDYELKQLKTTIAKMFN